MVKADTSLIGYGTILSQEFEGKNHPIAYLAHSFTETECNYSTHDRKVLAIVKAFEEWCTYLILSPHSITVTSDHEALRYFSSMQNLNRRHAH
jgi:hypothetical protein